MLDAVGGLIAPLLLAYGLEARLPGMPAASEAVVMAAMRHRSSAVPCSAPRREPCAGEPAVDTRNSSALLTPATSRPLDRGSESSLLPLRSTRWDNARFRRLDTTTEPRARRYATPQQTCPLSRLGIVLFSFGLYLIREGGSAPQPTGTPPATAAGSNVRPVLSRNTVGLSADF